MVWEVKRLSPELHTLFIQIEVYQHLHTNLDEAI